MTITAPEWSEAVRARDSRERSTFLESHLDLVRYLALRISSRLPSSVEVDDLIHDGVLGLIDAVDRFDEGRGVRFRTYAETRIRGAIMDGLRQKDWKPRSLRRRKRDLDEVLAQLGASHRRAVTEEEIAQAMGVGLDEYRTLLTQLHCGSQLSLDELPGGGDSVSSPGESADAPLERRELFEVLAEEITRLPERERRILELYYFERLNMKEIGGVLGVTESRVCQLHAQAAARIRVGMHRKFGARRV